MVLFWGGRVCVRQKKIFCGLLATDGGMGFHSNSCIVAAVAVEAAKMRNLAVRGAFISFSICA